MEENRPKRIISLGWGVQSFTIAAMVALGDLPPVDAAIHADTGWERSATYEFSQRWAPWLEGRGVRVLTVRDKTAGGLTMSGGLLIPVFTARESGEESGTMRRQCTGYWKMAPVKRKMQEIRGGQLIEKWLGISKDEIDRVKPSDVKYCVHRFPLLEMIGRPISRAECVEYLKKHGLEVPKKSACIFCPYQNRKDWAEVKSSAGDWASVLAVDEKIRNMRPGFASYLTSKRLPIGEIDFSSPEDNGQLSLWDESEECSGSCFL